MWVSIISALVCFAVVVILFTPSFRGLAFYRPLSFYFIFAGLWSVINFVVHSIWPGADIMLWLNYIGTILFAGYLLFALYAYYMKSSSSDKCEEDKDNNKEENDADKGEDKNKNS